jgi:flagella basal body P-ring formation protein FlgA
MLRDYLAGLLIVLVSSSVSAADLDVTLTGKKWVTSDVVTVGDIFDNTGEYATYALAPAPEVGKKLMLSKNDLQRIVETFRLNWKAPEEDISVALERDAIAVDADALIDALEKSDLTAKISTDAKFVLTEPAGPIVLEGRALPELAVTKTAFDPATERFTATLRISRDGESIKEVALAGIATPMLRVPVLTATIPPNAVISRSDIVEKVLPKRTVRADTVLSAEALVGMAPKRTLQADQPILNSELTPPLMIKRNELVTVIYRNGPILLSTRARALANGTRGDSVTLMNLNSKKPFEAIVTGPQQAEVSAAQFNG